MAKSLLCFAYKRGRKTLSRVSQMQGVPAHLEHLKCGEKRRNKARCYFSKHIEKYEYLCLCEKNTGYFNKRCPSSSRCDYYEEK